MKENYDNNFIIKRVGEKIWKIEAGSNIYFLDFCCEKILVGTGSRSERKNVETFLSKIVDFNKVTSVIFTHLHKEEVGNFDLFPNARFFASEKEIEDFKKRPFATVLDDLIAEKLKSVNLCVLPECFGELKIINTPGHTRGSVCLWLGKERILFSGHTLINFGPGRTDFPTSEKELMQESLNKLVEYNFKILCPS